MATLNLPDGSLAQTWRAIKDHLQSNSTLSQADIALVFLDDDPESIRSIATYGGAVVKIVPGLANPRQFDEASYSVDLTLDIEAFLPTLDVDDYLNLHSALTCALNALTDTAFQKVLVDAGASVEQVDCRQALAFVAGQAGDNTTFNVRGRYVVSVQHRMTCCP